MRTTALYGTLFVLIAGALIIFATTDYTTDLIEDYKANAANTAPHKQTHFNQPTKSGWVFDWEKDGRNYGLTEEQCNFAFPELYKEIERAVMHRKDKLGLLQEEDMDVVWRGDGMVQAMIHDKQLYIINPLEVTDHNNRPRAIATMHSIQRAISAFPGKLPNIEFSFSVHDFALHDPNTVHALWAYTRLPHQESLWLMPDFGLWAWPDVGLRSYPEFQMYLQQQEDDFQDKIPKLVWRGSVDVGSKDVRHGLVEHTENQPWSDVQILDWSNTTNIEERLLTMQDHCRYKFVAQTEGNSYSGRLKYLLNCQSVLFSHEMSWLELFHHLMIDSGPDQNYVRAKRDYSDIAKKMKRLLDPDHEFETRRIAHNAVRTFRQRYLTPAAEACYWRALIRGWSSVMGFEVEFWKEVEEWDKVSKMNVTKRKPRGAPFESYAIMEEVEWAIPAKARKMCFEEK